FSLDFLGVVASLDKSVDSVLTVTPYTLDDLSSYRLNVLQLVIWSDESVDDSLDRLGIVPSLSESVDSVLTGTPYTLDDLSSDLVDLELCCLSLRAARGFRCARESPLRRGLTLLDLVVDVRDQLAVPIPVTVEIRARASGRVEVAVATDRHVLLRYQAVVQVQVGHELGAVVEGTLVEHVVVLSSRHVEGCVGVLDCNGVLIRPLVGVSPSGVVVVHELVDVVSVDAVVSGSLAASGPDVVASSVCVVAAHVAVEHNHVVGDEELNSTASAALIVGSGREEKLLVELKLSPVVLCWCTFHTHCISLCLPETCVSGSSFFKR